LSSIPLNWRTNLRANLDLWPDVSQNITTLCRFDGQVYDETAILPDNDRAVRQTAEILALSGLAYKEGAPPIFHLTNLGRCLFSFLGVIGATKFANDANRYLLAEALIRALSVVLEYRAVWELMLRTANILTNEELNRAMGRLTYLADIPATAQAILKARDAGTVTAIGPRLYEDSKFGGPNENDQRKAINPIFLLAGGGRIFLQLDQSSENRRLDDWAVPLIKRQLEEPASLMHADTNAETVQFISKRAALPTFWSP
jgi:hypothetical protein